MIKKVLWLLVVVGVIGLLSLSSVAAQEAGVSRSLPAGPVAPGDELEVTISNVGLADGGGIAVETLPAGFSYVDDSAVVTNGGSKAGIGALVSGETVSFSLVSVDSFTYKVAVGSEVGESQHTFSGVLQKLSGDEPIGGDDSVTVEAGATTPPTAGPTAQPDTTPGGVSRSLPAGPVAPGDELEVTISNVGLADGGGIAVETLPAGFSYVDDSAVVTNGGSKAGIGALVSGETVSFSLVSVDSFTYKVAVGSEVGESQHTFSGVLQKLSGDEPIGGDDSVTVEAGATTPPTEGPTAQPDTGTPGPRGPAGRRGNTGPDGPKGNTGATGAAGPKGDTGAAGATGAAGLKGDTGAAGPKGDTGAAGPKGDTGAAGPKGDTGPAGATGPKGNTGATGAAGPKGDTGPAGPAGPAGATGTAGLKGDTGATGAAGLKGDTGAAGAAGPKGDTGDAGPKGDTGAAGAAGSIVLGIVSLILSFVAVLVAGGVLLMRRRD